MKHFNDNVLSRAAQPEDYERIRDLLIETQTLAPLGFNWDIRRWEGMRWYDPRVAGNADWYRDSQLWETGAGQPIGLVHADGIGFPYLEVHPDYRYLEVDMITWAEEYLTEPAPDNAGRRLQFFVFDYDVHRQGLLAARGYQEMGFGGGIRHLRLGHQPLAAANLAQGYTMRTPQPENDHDAQQLADLLNASFHRTIHNALEYQQFTRSATCFQAKLDLVAVAPDGRFAAYVGIPYDEINKRGIFEPVCTHPDHQQKGLAKALMQEGLRRLRAWGAVDVVVETGDMIPANRLYDSLGFTEMYKGHMMQKTFRTDTAPVESP